MRAPAAATRTGALASLAQLFGDARSRLRGSRRLRRSLGGWLASGLVYTEAFCVAVALLHGSGWALVAVGAAIWWAFVALFMIAGAPLLVTPAGVRIDYYGVPNGLTAWRAWSALPLILATSLSLPHDLGLIVWCVGGGAAGMLDYVDGMVARHHGPLTELGRAIDPAMDALFFSVAAVASMQVGIIPPWLAALILVRYLGPLVATPVVFGLGGRPQLGHTVWGRRSTALVGLVVFVLMWLRIFHGPVGTVALIIGLPLLVPTTMFHFWSLVERVRRSPTA